MNKYQQNLIIYFGKICKKTKNRNEIKQMYNKTRRYYEVIIKLWMKAMKLE